MVWPSYVSRKKGAHKFCVGGKERCSSFAADLDHDAAPLQYTIAFLSALDWVFGFARAPGLNMAPPIAGFREWEVRRWPVPACRGKPNASDDGADYLFDAVNGMHCTRIILCAIDMRVWRRCHGSGATIRPRGVGSVYWHLFRKYGRLSMNRATAG